MHWKLTLSVVVLAGALAACAQEPAKPSATHLGIDLPPPPAQAAGSIPPPIQVAPVLPKPEPKAAPETYSVVVNGVPAQELLFALARDARINIDVHPGITGSVTLNAVDQTLPQLLERISRQVEMRYELSGPNLQVLPEPFCGLDFVTASRNVRWSRPIRGGGSTSGQPRAAAGAAGPRPAPARRRRSTSRPAASCGKR
jgi:general secretion pathway protein D